MKKAFASFMLLFRLCFTEVWLSCLPARPCLTLGVRRYSQAVLYRSLVVLPSGLTFASPPGYAVIHRLYFTEVWLPALPGGGDDGIRTHDPLLAGQVLSQLSYTPV